MEDYTSGDHTFMDQSFMGMGQSFMVNSLSQSMFNPMSQSMVLERRSLLNARRIVRELKKRTVVKPRPIRAVENGEPLTSSTKAQMLKGEIQKQIIPLREQEQRLRRLKHNQEMPPAEEAIKNLEEQIYGMKEALAEVMAEIQQKEEGQIQERGVVTTTQSQADYNRRELLLQELNLKDTELDVLLNDLRRLREPVSY